MKTIATRLPSHPRGRAWQAFRLGALLATAAVVLLAGVPGGDDEWRPLVDAGDRLAATGGTAMVGQSVVTARTAYLLAFHHAQDHRDTRRMLIVAERLAKLGDEALAAHIRRAAQEEAAQGPPATLPPARPARTDG